MFDGHPIFNRISFLIIQQYAYTLADNIYLYNQRSTTLTD